MDGLGTFTQANGVKYEGDFVCNVPMGRGTYTWSDGSTYVGDIYRGIRQGMGTYRCNKHGVSYGGQWHQGKRHGQHGSGTHIWNLKRVDGSQYAQSNQYQGDFFQGQRHGKGSFYYAGGVIYTGEWRNNKKHGKGKLTAKSGRVFECEFDNDLMKTSLNENRAPTPSGTLPISDIDSSILGADMASNIEGLSEKIHDRNRETEHKQVELVVSSHHVESRLIYSFYSRLGCSHPLDNIFSLSRSQFWRMSKDCNIHHHGVNSTQIERFTKEEAGLAETCSPFTSMHLHEFLMGLVTVAYFIYSKDLVSKKHLLAACLSRFMTNDVLPNSRNVKGFSFRQPEVAVEASKYANRCWEIFDHFCRINSAQQNEKSMTCRQMSWMFKDLRSFDHQSTVTRLSELITPHCNQCFCVESELVFSEFFEVLLGCVEIKFHQVSDASLHISPNNLFTEKSPEEGNATSQDVEHEDIKHQELKEPHFAEKFQDQKCVEISGKMATEHQVQRRISTVQQFFNHSFLPAVDHHWSVTRQMEIVTQRVRDGKVVHFIENSS